MTSAMLPLQAVPSSPPPSFLPHSFPPRRGPGLFWKTLAILASLSLVPLAAAYLLFLQPVQEGLSRAARQLELAVVAAVTRSVDAELKAGVETLVTWGEVLLGSGTASDTVRLEQVRASLATSPLLRAVTVYTLTGDPVVSLSTEEIALDSQAPLEDSLRRALTAPDLSPGAWVAGRSLRLKDAPGIEVGILVASEGRARGILVGVLSLLPLCQTLADLQRDRFHDLPESLFVIDATRALIAHPNPQRALERTHMGEESLVRGLLGEPSFKKRLGLALEAKAFGQSPARVGSLESIPALGWAVVVQRPWSEVYAPVEDMLVRLGVAGVILALLSLAVAARAAIGMVRPLEALMAGAERVARRDFSARVPVTRRDELGQLSEQFNTMAADLQGSEARLQQEWKIRADLSRFLEARVVDAIVADPGKLSLGGERRQVTVLFADLDDFLGMAELLEPVTLVQLLNEFFTIATEILMKHGGMVDKFVGDCIMGVFGAPETQEDHALRAVEAAEDLLRWVETANRRWEATYGVRLDLSIGIHTGPVVAGTVGSDKRMEYTVIGETVAIAARLERLARPGQILISAATEGRLDGQVPCEEAGLHTVTGRSGATLVFQVKTD